MIPTAQEFLSKNNVDIVNTMIKFAKLHVKSALEAAFNNSEMRVSENDTNEHPSFTDYYDNGNITITISKNSILDSYPLTNIK